MLLSLSKNLRIIKLRLLEYNRNTCNSSTFYFTLNNIQFFYQFQWQVGIFDTINSQFSSCKLVTVLEAMKFFVFNALFFQSQEIPRYSVEFKIFLLELLTYDLKHVEI